MFTAFFSSTALTFRSDQVTYFSVVDIQDLQLSDLDIKNTRLLERHISPQIIFYVIAQRYDFSTSEPSFYGSAHLFDKDGGFAVHQKDGGPPSFLALHWLPGTYRIL